MKILVLSDLHLEFKAPQPTCVCRHCGERFGLKKCGVATWHLGQCGVCQSQTGVTAPDHFGGRGSDWTLSLPDPSAYDVVVLAGDVHSHTHAIPWATKTFPNKDIVYVSGNHEFYDSHLHGMSVELKKCTAEHPRVHLLDNSNVIINGVRFIGATLWTDFQLFGNEIGIVGQCLRVAKHSISDFGLIRFGSTGWMTPGDTVKMFRISASYIRQELAIPHEGQTVVVTHHLPSKRSVSTRFENEILSAAFASNLDHLVEQADAWIHGHTHDSFDYQLGKCRVVCNPRGYPTWKGTYENPNFTARKIIEVGS